MYQVLSEIPDLNNDVRNNNQEEWKKGEKQDQTADRNNEKCPSNVYNGDETNDGNFAGKSTKQSLPQQCESRFSHIKDGLESSVSSEGKERIERIVGEVNSLSDVEKLLLYLKLPTGAASEDQTRQTPTSFLHSSNRIEQAQAFTWIRSHLEEDAEICVPKHEVFDDYRLYCESHTLKPLCPADFGKVMKCVFPNVKPRRLGQRGQSKYCYSGLRKKLEVQPPSLPELEITPKRENVEYSEENELSMASRQLVCEWAQKLLGRSFGQLQELAEFLVGNLYVNSKSTAAFTVLAAMQEAGLQNSKVPVCSLFTSSSGGNKHKEMQLQLQRKLAERELIKEQKKKLQQHRSEVEHENEKLRSEGFLTPSPAFPSPVKYAARNITKLLQSPVSHSENRRIPESPKLMKSPMCFLNTSEAQTLVNQCSISSEGVKKVTFLNTSEAQMLVNQCSVGSEGVKKVPESPISFNSQKGISSLSSEKDVSSRVLNGGGVNLDVKSAESGVASVAGSISISMPIVCESISTNSGSDGNKAGVETGSKGESSVSHSVVKQILLNDVKFTFSEQSSSDIFQNGVSNKNQVKSQSGKDVSQNASSVRTEKFHIVRKPAVIPSAKPFSQSTSCPALAHNGGTIQVDGKRKAVHTSMLNVNLMENGKAENSKTSLMTDTLSKASSACGSLPSAFCSAFVPVTNSRKDLNPAASPQHNQRSSVSTDGSDNEGNQMQVDFDLNQEITDVSESNTANCLSESVMVTSSVISAGDNQMTLASNGDGPVLSSPQTPKRPRSRFAPIRPKVSPIKTISSILKETKGVENQGPAYDSRPVSAILKEKRAKEAQGLLAQIASNVQAARTTTPPKGSVQMNAEVMKLPVTPSKALSNIPADVIKLPLTPNSGSKTSEVFFIVNTPKTGTVQQQIVTTANSASRNSNTPQLISSPSSSSSSSSSMPVRVKAQKDCSRTSASSTSVMSTSESTSGVTVFNPDSGIESSNSVSQVNTSLPASMIFTSASSHNEVSTALDPSTTTVCNLGTFSTSSTTTSVSNLDSSSISVGCLGPSTISVGSLGPSSNSVGCSGLSSNSMGNLGPSSNSMGNLGPSSNSMDNLGPSNFSNSVSSLGSSGITVGSLGPSSISGSNLGPSATSSVILTSAASHSIQKDLKSSKDLSTVTSVINKPIPSTVFVSSVPMQQGIPHTTSHAVSSSATAVFTPAVSQPVGSINLKSVSMDNSNKSVKKDSNEFNEQMIVMTSSSDQPSDILGRKRKSSEQETENQIFKKLNSSEVRPQKDVSLFSLETSTTATQLRNQASMFVSNENGLQGNQASRFVTSETGLQEDMSLFSQHGNQVFSQPSFDGLRMILTSGHQTIRVDNLNDKSVTSNANDTSRQSKSHPGGGVVKENIQKIDAGGQSVRISGNKLSLESLESDALLDTSPLLVDQDLVTSLGSKSPQTASVGVNAKSLHPTQKQLIHQKMQLDQQMSSFLSKMKGPNTMKQIDKAKAKHLLQRVLQQSQGSQLGRNIQRQTKAASNTNHPPVNLLNLLQSVNPRRQVRKSNSVEIVDKDHNQNSLDLQSSMIVDASQPELCMDQMKKNDFPSTVQSYDAHRESILNSELPSEVADFITEHSQDRMFQYKMPLGDINSGDFQLDSLSSSKESQLGEPFTVPDTPPVRNKHSEGNTAMKNRAVPIQRSISMPLFASTAVNLVPQAASAAVNLVPQAASTAVNVVPQVASTAVNLIPQAVSKPQDGQSYQTSEGSSLQSYNIQNVGARQPGRRQRQRSVERVSSETPDAGYHSFDASPVMNLTPSSVHSSNEAHQESSYPLRSDSGFVNETQVTQNLVQMSSGQSMCIQSSASSSQSSNYGSTNAFMPIQGNTVSTSANINKTHRVTLIKPTVTVASSSPDAPNTSAENISFTSSGQKTAESTSGARNTEVIYCTASSHSEATVKRSGVLKQLLGRKDSLPSYEEALHHLKSHDGQLNTTPMKSEQSSEASSRLTNILSTSVFTGVHDVKPVYSSKQILQSMIQTSVSGKGQFVPAGPQPVASTGNQQSLFTATMPQLVASTGNQQPLFAATMPQLVASTGNQQPLFTATMPQLVASTGNQQPLYAATMPQPVASTGNQQALFAAAIPQSVLSTGNQQPSLFAPPSPYTSTVPPASPRGQAIISRTLSAPPSSPGVNPSTVPASPHGPSSVPPASPCRPPSVPPVSPCGPRSVPPVSPHGPRSVPPSVSPCGPPPASPHGPWSVPPPVSPLGPHSVPPASPNGMILSPKTYPLGLPVASPQGSSSSYGSRPGSRQGQMFVSGRTSTAPPLSPCASQPVASPGSGSLGMQPASPYDSTPSAILSYGSQPNVKQNSTREAKRVSRSVGESGSTDVPKQAVSSAGDPMMTKEFPFSYHLALLREKVLADPDMKQEHHKGNRKSHVKQEISDSTTQIRNVTSVSVPMDESSSLIMSGTKLSDISFVFSNSETNMEVSSDYRLFENAPINSVSMQSQSVGSLQPQSISSLAVSGHNQSVRNPHAERTNPIGSAPLLAGLLNSHTDQESNSFKITKSRSSSKSDVPSALLNALGNSRQMKNSDPAGTRHRSGDGVSMDLINAHGNNRSKTTLNIHVSDATGHILKNIPSNAKSDASSKSSFIAFDLPNVNYMGRAPNIDLASILPQKPVDRKQNANPGNIDFSSIFPANSVPKTQLLNSSAKAKPGSIPFIGSHSEVNPPNVNLSALLGEQTRSDGNSSKISFCNSDLRNLLAGQSNIKTKNVENDSLFPPNQSISSCDVIPSTSSHVIFTSAPLRQNNTSQQAPVAPVSSSIENQNQIGAHFKERNSNWISQTSRPNSSSIPGECVNSENPLLSNLLSKQTSSAESSGLYQHPGFDQNLNVGQENGSDLISSSQAFDDELGCTLDILKKLDGQYFELELDNMQPSLPMQNLMQDNQTVLITDDSS